MKIARLMQDGNETYGLIKDGNVATKDSIIRETGVPLPLNIMDFLFTTCTFCTPSMLCWACNVKYIRAILDSYTRNW